VVHWPHGFGAGYAVAARHQGSPERSAADFLPISDTIARSQRASKKDGRRAASVFRYSIIVVV
jgi:hypothetical protein